MVKTLSYTSLRGSIPVFSHLSLSNPSSRTITRATPHPTPFRVEYTYKYGEFFFEWTKISYSRDRRLTTLSLFELGVIDLVAMI